MSTVRRLGLLGGTFDPVHYGHLDAAEAARTTLALDAVVFIPAYAPPHRASLPRASVFHRFALIALAVSGHPGMRVSDRELVRATPSYTADTLRALHEEGWHRSQLFFILGTDAFADIATWREYPAVLDGANFVVMARPGTRPEQALARTPDLMARVRQPTLSSSPAGHTWVHLMEASTRDVSSTLVRRRLAAGEPVADLVPDAVAQHIAAHHLYGAVDTLHG